MGLYEQFNEILFESYCKTSIDRAITKARMKKQARSEWEQSLSELTDASMYELVKDTDGVEIPDDGMTFSVQGSRVIIGIPQVGQALLRLLPKDRDIVLLYYFKDMTDDEIAVMLKMSRATVQRRRANAKQKLRLILGEIE